MQLTLDMLAVVQWLLMMAPEVEHPRLARIEAYLLERYNRE